LYAVIRSAATIVPRETRTCGGGRRDAGRRLARGAV